jgi:tetratricopeptide (TPR) repeat protein
MGSVRKVPNNSVLAFAAVLVILFFAFLAYWPGINGPFVFDDYANIVDNSYLKLPSLDSQSLTNAAMSSESGPLKRPIPMVTFALNYYFSGNADNPFQFKITNVLIHAINGLLVFCIFYLGAKQYTAMHGTEANSGNRWILFFATLAALLWVLHPIHLTSVLYIVQRMTSLSAMFVLAAILTYLYGRSFSIAGQSAKGWTISVVGVLCFGILGLLSKENAALLPFYIVLIEFTLFRSEFPLNLWDRVSRRGKKLIFMALLLVAVFAILYAIHLSLPGYAGRPFSFTERVLSQPRILLFYLFLIFFPRTNAFGIFHDDIVLSDGLLNPWTTVPAMFAVTSLWVLAIVLYKNHRPLTFAIFWFFISHLLESTFYPLEPAHEHRNYLAVIGPVTAILYISLVAARLTGKRILRSLPLFFLALFAINTPLRAWHWSDLASLHDFEARNHPNSARAQSSLGSMLAQARKYQEAKQAFLRAAQLRPHEVTDLINVRIILAWQRKPPSNQLTQDIVERVKHGLQTPLTNQVLDYAVKCAALDCADIRGDLLVWLPVYIDRNQNRSRLVAHYHYLYARVLLLEGRQDDAVKSLLQAIDRYYRHLHPYFLLADIYLKQGELAKAGEILKQLEVANEGNSHPRDREIKLLSDKIQSVRSRSSR